MTILVDYSRNDLLTEQARTLLTQFYCRDDEDPQDAFARGAKAFCRNDFELAQRIYDYASKGWFMFSSPILSNAPAEGEKIRGLPISCFLSYVPDSLDGLIGHSTELRWLSVKGGGVGGHWSDIRSVSDVAPSPIPFIKTVDSDMTAYRQGKTRKGSYAAYMDASHPDIIEFINIRVPTGGDPNRKAFNIHNAVNITDAFMEQVNKGGMWNLIDPNDKSIRDSMPARELWERILETRFRTGEPYLNFIDEANRHLPPSMIEKGLKIHGSNLCNEIHLPTSEDRTAVCCLSSVNLEFFEEWKGTTMVADLITMLDNVISFFIEYAPKELRKAAFSATQERSLGLGAMGFHSALQRKSIPWESPMATAYNTEMFTYIKAEAKDASVHLAEERGSCPDVDGVRNSHLLAIAPNANSSIITGCSASIEPLKSNAFTHRTRVGAHLVKNSYLADYINSVSDDLEWIEEQWTSIILHEGSVQHLDWMDDWEKEVFKTAFELDQRWVVDHAAARQPFICQGQSVNLFFPSGTDKKYVNEVHLRAFNKKLKGLYYLRTSASSKADTVSFKPTRVALEDFAEDDDCPSCQG
jgi:ribonucleoside-diphosphate reductase alpha chain|tara:strand:- start:2177 stop:3922 length:1746 start_codon:yes stop_codon:yes gene_type:complete